MIKDKCYNGGEKRKAYLLRYKEKRRACFFF